MNAREVESLLLDRCTTVALRNDQAAQDQREANVFRMAALIMHAGFPNESKQLMQASEQYFARHPQQQLSPVEVLHRGWVISLPRLREMLSHRLQS